MRSTDALFGNYLPGTSVWHRAGVGWKYLVVLVLTLPALIVQQPWATTVALVITVLGLQFGNVLAGAVLVETVFNWPGLGRLAFDSVLRRDYPTILGILLFSSILVVVMNLVTDLVYRVVDPRIKTS